MKLPPGLESDLERGRALDAGEVDGEIRCAVCRVIVTRPELAMRHEGRERHEFQNPAGFRFEVALFREARCVAPDPPTFEFTWFAGYAWQLAFCGNCGGQLGWYYSGGDGEFYGLIVDRLLGL